MPLIGYRTRRCIICKCESVISVDEESLHKFLKGMFIQDAFPNLSPDERELIKTGIHPECWETLKAPDDE